MGDRSQEGEEATRARACKINKRKIKKVRATDVMVLGHGTVTMGEMQETYRAHTVPVKIITIYTNLLACEQYALSKK